MSLKAELVQWVSAVQAFDDGDYEEALNIFQTIADSSKIYFNIGMILQNMRRHEDAILAYQDAIACDNFLSIAYFQKGVNHFILRNYAEALEDFNDSLLYLRGNFLIDYTQLGLDFKLYSCEILHNRALASFQLGDDDAALADLAEALQTKQLPEHVRIDEAIDYRGDGCQLFEVPEKIVYRPPAAKVENANRVDYLGQSKVIAAVDENDNYAGFKGATMLRNRDRSSSVPQLNQGRPNLTIGTGGPLGRKNSASMNTPPLPSPGARARKNSAPLLDSRPGTPNTFSRPQDMVRSPVALRDDYRAPSPRGDPRDRDFRDGRDDYRAPPTPTKQLMNSFDRRMENERTRSPMMSERSMPRRESFGSVRSGGSDGYTGSPTFSRGGGDSSGKLRVKVHFTDTRMMLLPSDCTYEDLLYRIQDKFNTSKPLRIKFRDEDGSLVLMTDDDDLLLAREVYAIGGGGEGKFEVWVE